MTQEALQNHAQALINAITANQLAEAIAKIIKNETKYSVVHGSYQNRITPVIHAALKGRKDVEQLLLDRGADVKKSDSDDQTPLMYARINMHQKVIEVFNSYIEYGNTQSAMLSAAPKTDDTNKESNTISFDVSTTGAVETSTTGGTDESESWI